MTISKKSSSSFYNYYCMECEKSSSETVIFDISLKHNSNMRICASCLSEANNTVKGMSKNTIIKTVRK